ncbi:MAG: hypothetical protein GY694_23010 [Gammaproteobacteria bacterium]|nr:hypothetical protein [Gammaproteobacteria bacterium]
MTKISSTSLHTKVHPTIAKNLTDICVDACLAIKPLEGQDEIDLHMVEIMEMQHRYESVLQILLVLKNKTFGLVHSKWDLVGYSGGSPGLENAVKRWGWPIGPICFSVYFDASP